MVSLQEILDPDRGTAALIRATNYNSKDLPVNQHPWATEVTRHLIDFQRLVFSITTLPLQIKVQVRVVARPFWVWQPGVG